MQVFECLWSNISHKNMKIVRNFTILGKKYLYHHEETQDFDQIIGTQWKKLMKSLDFRQVFQLCLLKFKLWIN